MIGNVRCYWLNEMGVPRITIGPTWMFAVPLFIAVLFLLYCFLSGLYYLQATSLIYRLIALVLIAIDFGAYLYTLF